MGKQLQPALVRLIWVLICACLMFSAANSIYAAGELPENPRAVYVIPMEGTIENGLVQFLERAYADADENGADVILLEVNTLGGGVAAAQEIGDIMKASPIPTVAFIKGRAISAGSYISLLADQIVMSPGSSIGAAAVVDISGTHIRDSKTLAFWIGEMTAAAESSGRNPDYAAGMVDDQLVVSVPEIDKTYGKDTLISFNYQEALKAGYAEAIKETRADVLAYLNAENAQIIEIEKSFAEKLASFINHPAVMTILLLAGFGGVFIEILAPGFGLPGTIGIAAFAIYFGGQFIAGAAGIEHMLLFGAGIVLLIVEIFVPSFGILFAIGTICLFSGIILAASNTSDAVLSLTIAFVLAIIVVVFAAKYLGKKGIWNKFILRDQFSSEKGYVSSSSKSQWLGKTGVAVTTLRPAGTAIIDDERLDVVTSGEYIKAGRQVQVIKAEGSWIVVKELKSEQTAEAGQEQTKRQAEDGQKDEPTVLSDQLRK